MFDDRIVYPKIKVSKLELDNENRGLKIALMFIRGKIVSSRLASLVFQEEKVLNRSGIGGFFTTRSFVNILYLNKAYLRDGKLRFRNDEDAAVFLHECSHYLHIVSNQGKYTQRDDEFVTKLPPASIKITPESRYYAEREAWTLSLSIDRLFRIGLEDAINKINAKNMLAVEATLGLRRLKKGEVEELQDKLTISDFHFKR